MTATGLDPFLWKIQDAANREIAALGLPIAH